MLHLKSYAVGADGDSQKSATTVADTSSEPSEQLGNREEIERLLDELQESEARVVRMYHLEGRSYREISSAVGVPENSIGPILSRARSKLRRGVNQPTG